MTRLIFILILQAFFVCEAGSQTITVDDLLNLPSIPIKNIDHFMNKRGFVSTGGSLQYDAPQITFIQKKPKKKKAPLSVIRSLDMIKDDDGYSFVFHTSSLDEFNQGKKELKENGFYFDRDRDTSSQAALLFQRRTETVMADHNMTDSLERYNFYLVTKVLPEPGSIQTAEDLLQFDSHEYLATVFGIGNVKKDAYYFTDKEMRKCSILFANTSRQAIFVWEDEGDMRKLSYVLISSISPTLSAARYSGLVSPNRWTTKTGLHASMSIRELLQINGEDFEFYGINSEFAYMVEPKHDGNIDFKKTGVMLGCLDCSDSKLLEKQKISAANAVDKNLYLHVFYLMLRK